MSQKKKAKVVSPEEVPEVAHFIAVKQKIDALKDSYPEVFRMLDSLTDEYNTALEAADKAVRGKKISCGPFDLYQFQKSYDADKLYEELGREKFFAVGGIERTVKVLEVDKAKIEAAIASNAIPKQVADIAVTESPRFKKPEKISV